MRRCSASIRVWIFGLTAVLATTSAQTFEIEETTIPALHAAIKKGEIICTGETYKAAVKLTFAKGAAVKDPKKLFISSLEGNTRRAIDIREGENIDEKALKALIRAAATVNASPAPKKPKKKA